LRSPAHLPPEFIQVPEYMQALAAFINENQPPKHDLIKVALAHHRFGWIHPCGNGNGRVVRLLTYALLIKYGFNVKAASRTNTRGRHRQRHCRREIPSACTAACPRMVRTAPGGTAEGLGTMPPVAATNAH